MEKVFETLGAALRPAPKSCSCVNVEMGSYDNQVDLPLPWNGKIVGIDRCIEAEVVGLWDLGIRTTWSCCGHNVKDAVIGVEEEYIPQMISLGYMVWKNPCRPDDSDSFYAKSI